MNADKTMLTYKPADKKEGENLMNSLDRPSNCKRKKIKKFVTANIISLVNQEHHQKRY